MSHVDNIIYVYLNATDSEITEGMEWYSNAFSLATALSPDNVWRGAGVISAFSPICPWWRNKQLAINTFETGIATGHTTMFNTFAQRIYDGEHPLMVLKGPKQRAFCAAIATNGQTDIATIDRHAYDIAMGMVNTKRNITKNVFHQLSNAYSEAALLAGISTAQMQAITWVAWRNRKGVKS